MFGNSRPRLYVYGVTVEQWTRRWGVEPFSCECYMCGETLTTTVPFAQGTLRGLASPPCRNGCHDEYLRTGSGSAPPYALVRDARYGDLLDQVDE